jgi:hypothetical protein
MSHYYYDPSKVLVSWGNGANSPRLTGFTSGSFVSVEIASPEANVRKGIDGGAAVLPKFDLSGTVTLTFQQGSVGNMMMQEVVSYQERNPGVVPQGDLTIDDSSGTFNLNIGGAIIQTQPSIGFSKLASEGTRVWVLYSNNITYRGRIDVPQTTNSTVQQLISALF